LVSAASDLDVALRFARAAGLSAAENVEANLPFIDDPETRATLANQTAASVAALERLTQS
jgi:formiminotetrahydrofolate cyclodeaminase